MKKIYTTIAVILILAQSYAQDIKVSYLEDGDATLIEKGIEVDYFVKETRAVLNNEYKIVDGFKYQIRTVYELECYKTKKLSTLYFYMTDDQTKSFYIKK